jgi:prepilin-type processing-associated H-X9-DG protein
MPMRADKPAQSGAFTMVELLSIIVIVAILALLAAPVASRVKIATSKTISAHSLSQLITAGRGYLSEHEGWFWPYAEYKKEGTQFWFGWEDIASQRRPEGEREVDFSQGPLGPYVITAGGVRTDPSFAAYGSRLKPKFKNGNYGYGYNEVLGNDGVTGKPRNVMQAQSSTDIVVFATSAQVNTFQKPASARNPMIEEFYLINASETTVHFRHGGKALAAMLDGSVREFEMDPATRDKRMPDADIGRFAPRGSMKFLW